MVRTVEERLTKAELARRLHVSARTVDRYVSAGLLQVERLPGGAPRFRASAVERMIREASRRGRSFFSGES